MDPILAEQIGYVVGGMVGIVAIGATAFVALMCFPTIRTAFAERLRLRALRHGDATDITAQLAGLRGEVYALRSELARALHGIPPAPEDRNGLLVESTSGRDRSRGTA